MELWKIIAALALMFVLGILLGMRIFAKLILFNAQLRLNTAQLKVFLQYLLIVFDR